jgi:hypothetical protein
MNLTCSKTTFFHDLEISDVWASPCPRHHWPHNHSEYWGTDKRFQTKKQKLRDGMLMPKIACVVGDEQTLKEKSLHLNEENSTLGGRMV